MRGDAPAPCSLVWPAMRHAAGRARRCAATGTGTGAIYVSRGWCEKRPSSAVRGAVVYSYTYSFVCVSACSIQCYWFGPHRCKRIFAHVRMTSYWGALGSHFSVLGGPGEPLGGAREEQRDSWEPRGVPGGSRRVLGRPWGALGRSLEGLGRNLGDPWGPQRVPLAAQGGSRGSQGVPWGSQGISRGYLREPRGALLELRAYIYHGLL